MVDEQTDISIDNVPRYVMNNQIAVEDLSTGAEGVADNVVWSTREKYSKSDRGNFFHLS